MSDDSPRAMRERQAARLQAWDDSDKANHQCANAEHQVVVVIDRLDAALSERDAALARVKELEAEHEGCVRFISTGGGIGPKPGDRVRFSRD